MKRQLVHGATVLFLLVALVSPASAQDDIVHTSKDFTVVLGPPYPVVDAPTKLYFTKGNTLISVKIEGKDITLMTHDAGTLKLLTTRLQEGELKDRVFEGVIELGDRFFLTYSEWDKAKGIMTLYEREIDVEAGNFTEKASELLRVSGKVSGTLSMTGFYRFGVTDQFNYHYSHDGNKVMVQYRKKPEVKDDSKSHDLIGLVCFGPGLEKLWEQEFRMPYTEEEMDIEDYSVDRDGNSYILAKVRKDGSDRDKKRGEDEANYRIELLRVKSNTSEVSTTPVAIGDKFISSISLYEAGDGGDMLCAGSYNTGGKKWYIADGIFYFLLGKDGGVSNLVFHEIPVDILNQYASKGEKKKNDKAEEEDEAGFRSLEMRKLYVAQDGSAVISGEQYYEVTTTTYSNGRTTTTTRYFYRDILVTKVNADGSLAWMRKLPKYQIGTNGRGGMGMEHIASGKSHYFFFLDNLKNMALTPDKAPARHMDGAGGFFTAYKIDDATGEVTRHSVFDMRDVKGTEVFQFMTSRIQVVDENEFVVEVYKKQKEDVLIKVKIND